MRINHNIAALNTHRQLGAASEAQGKSMEKLSSGLRINRAGDDAAGLAISEKMRGQIRGLDMASKNAQDGISFIQTAEGALNETHSILQRMRELAVQSSNDTNNNNDRKELQKEVDQLAEEMTRISNNTEFNTKSLLNGAVGSSGEAAATFHIGANQGQSLSLSIGAMDAQSLGVAAAKTTYSGVSAGNVDTATFADTLGSKVVNGANITFNYANVATATAGSATGTATVATAVAGDAGSFVFSIDGGATKTATIATGDTLAGIVTKINTAAGATVASVSGGKLAMASTTTGSTSSVKIDATSTAATLTYLGFTSGQTATGQDVSKTVTVSNGTTADDQVVTITDANATSLSVTSGNYAGVTINLDATKKLSDLVAANDKLTVASTTTNSSAATFANNKKTADAVTAKGIDISTQASANTSITAINTAIEKVSSERSKLGSVQNRLEHTINNLNTSSENLTAAESRVRDVDMAKEMMEQTKNSILAQAAQAMLAQANQQPQGVLQLLR